VVRKGRSVMLTSAGESLASVVNASFDAIRHELDVLPTRFKQPVSISAAPIIAENIILPALPLFSTEQSDVVLHLSLAYSDHRRNPTANIEISFQRMDRMLTEETVFLPGTAQPVAAPVLIKKYGNDLQRTLYEAPLISDEDSRMWTAWFRENSMPDGRANIGTRLFFEGSLLMQRAAIEGLGVALARSASIADDIKQGRLVALSSQMIDHNWAYIMRVNSKTQTEPETVRVVQWLRSLANVVANTPSKDGQGRPIIANKNDIVDKMKVRQW
jgi:LysR family glycine cleavage system transcriptional activator